MARAHIDKWAEWAKINVAGGFTEPVFWRVVRTAPAEAGPGCHQPGRGEAGQVTFDTAEAQLSRGAFLAGDDLTLADVQFGHVLFRYFDISITRQDRPALRRYYDALTMRPAFREHVMVPYEELRVLN